MRYIFKRLIIMVLLLLCIALVAYGIMYTVKTAVSVGDEISNNIDEKYELSEPTEDAATARRASLDSSDL